MTSPAGLTLLGLLLTESLPDADHDFKFNVIGDGTSFGVAESVTEVVTSLLADGDLVRRTRFGNREIAFPVEISGPDLASLAHGEAALRRVVGRGGDLVWQPPDDFAYPTAFDVITSSMEYRFDDFAEVKHKRRVFVVTLTCFPHGRSVDPVTVPALTVGLTPTTETLSNCSTTAGWSTSSPGVLSATGGYVQSTESAAGFGEARHYLFFAETADPALPYLVIEWQTTYPLAFGTGPTCVGVPLIETTALTDGWKRSTYDSTGFAGASFAFSALVRGSGGVFRIRNLNRTNVPPGQTPRQQTRVLEVGGTERTPASIHVSSENGTDPLGQAIVHTSPEDGSGYSPPLRRWRTSVSTGPETTDAATYSGKREPIAFETGGFVAEVPTEALPEGGYTLVARLRSLGAEGPTIYWSTSTLFPGDTDQQGFTNGQLLYSFPDTGWHLIPLATLSLPSVRTSAGKVQIVLQAIGSVSQIELDEAWLFREDDGTALTIVDTPSPHLWLDSPDANNSVPTVWVGDDMGARVHPGTGLRAMGAHILAPPGTAVFTAALSDNPETEATFHLRHDTHATS